MRDLLIDICHYRGNRLMFTKQLLIIKIRSAPMHSRTLYGAAKMAIGMALLSLLNLVCGGYARCQTPGTPAPNPKELHGGIEVSLRSVPAIVLRVPANASRGNLPTNPHSPHPNPFT